MAKIGEMDENAKQKWNEWFASRPPIIQELATRLPPLTLFRMKSTGHRVFLYSYNEDGTVSVIVSGKYNLVAFERNVFGIRPDDLEECDLPGPDEKVGVILDNPTTEDIKNIVEHGRKTIISRERLN